VKALTKTVCDKATLYLAVLSTIINRSLGIKLLYFA